MREGIEEADNGVCFLIGHRWMAGYAEFLAMNALGNRE
jgi:hypothetical protein